MGFLYAKTVPVTEHFSANIPLMKDILEQQDEYYQTLVPFVSTPYDLMVQLNDVGMDFTEVKKYELFCSLFRNLLEEYRDGRAKALDLILTGYDFTNLYPAINTKTNKVIFVDDNKNTIINEFVYAKTRATLCYINDIDTKEKRAADKETGKYLIERMRKKQEIARREAYKNSQLEDQIVALVNSKEFKYDFETVQNCTLYQFTRSLKQILKRINYDQVMSGYYAGTIDIKKVSKESLNWLSSK